MATTTVYDALKRCFKTDLLTSTASDWNLLLWRARKAGNHLPLPVGLVTTNTRSPGGSCTLQLTRWQLQLCSSPGGTLQFYTERFKTHYHNSILYDIPNREKLRSIQNCLDRVVTRSPRFCSVTALLISLQ